MIEDADKLTTEAQLSLRRTLETRIKKCRFIFLVNKEKFFIDQLYSRCLVFKLSSPTKQEINDILQNITVSENIKLTNQTKKILTDITSCCHRNLNLAIHYLEKAIQTKSKKIILSEIDIRYKYINEIIELIVKGRSLSIMTDIRKNLYTLLVNGIEPANIINMLFRQIIKRVEKANIEYINKICSITNNRDNTIRLGGKSMYHIESYCLHLFKIILELRKKITSKTTKTNKTNKTNSKTIVAIVNETNVAKKSVKKRKIIIKKKS